MVKTGQQIYVKDYGDWLYYKPDSSHDTWHIITVSTDYGDWLYYETASSHDTIKVIDCTTTNLLVVMIHGTSSQCQ